MVDGSVGLNLGVEVVDDGPEGGRDGDEVRAEGGSAEMSRLLLLYYSSKTSVVKKNK